MSRKALHSLLSFLLVLTTCVSVAYLVPIASAAVQTTSSPQTTPGHRRQLAGHARRGRCQAKADPKNFEGGGRQADRDHG